MVNCNYFISVTVYFTETEGRGLSTVHLPTPPPSGLLHLTSRAVLSCIHFSTWLLLGGKPLHFESSSFPPSLSLLLKTQQVPSHGIYLKAGVLGLYWTILLRLKCSRRFPVHSCPLKQTCVWVASQLGCLLFSLVTSRISVVFLSVGSLLHHIYYFPRCSLIPHTYLEHLSLATPSVGCGGHRDKEDRSPWGDR